jgi:MFS family permease
MTFSVLAVAVTSFALLQSMVMPVIPEIEAVFDTDKATASWVATSYLLSASVCTPLVGRIGDEVGKKRMLTLVLLCLSIGSLICALATDVRWVIAGRVVQGVGGGVIPLAFGVIRDQFPADRVSSSVSVVASMAGVGAATGLAISGPIVSVLGFRWLFWLPMIATAAAALGAARVIPESAPRAATLNWWPGLALSGWLVCILLAVSEGPSWGWASPRVQGLSVGGVLSFAVWVFLEVRLKTPLIDLRLLSLPGVGAASAVVMLLGATSFASFAFVPQLVQTPSSAGYGFGSTVTESGLLLVPTSVGSFVAGFAASRLVRRLGFRVVISAGCVLVALACSTLAAAHDSKLHICVAVGLLGIGNGAALAAIAALIVTSVPAGQTGVASGVNANIRTIGGAVGIAVLASIVTANAGSDDIPTERGYTIGFFVLAGAMFAASVVGIALPRGRSG